MRFLTLPELLKRRKKLIRDVRSYEQPSALVQAGIITAEEYAEMAQFVRESLADIEAEITERTGAVPVEGGFGDVPECHP